MVKDIPFIEPLKIGQESLSSFKKWRAGLTKAFYQENWLINILLFLFGRVIFFDEPAPFSLAFFAALLAVNYRRPWSAAGFSFLGTLSTGDYYNAAENLVYMIVCLVSIKKVDFLNRYRLIVPLMVFSVLFLGKSAAAVYQKASLYSLLLGSFQALTGLISAYIFINSLNIFDITAKKSSADHENIISLIIILTLAVAGIGEVKISDYSIRNIAGMIAVMILALSGVGLGASTGAAIGLMMSLAAANQLMAVNIYAVAGLLAGIFKQLGKVGVSLGFLVGGAISVLQFQPEMTEFVLTESAIAAGLFTILPVERLKLKIKMISEKPAETERTLVFAAINKLVSLMQIFYKAAELCAIGDANKKETSLRQTAAESFKIMAAVFDNLICSLYKEPRGLKKLAAKITESAARKNCALDQVLVNCSDELGVVIDILKSPCGAENECRREILPVAQKILNQKMTLKHKCAQSAANKKCRLKLTPVSRLNMDIGVAALAKDKNAVSGDAYMIMTLQPGETALIISDGMGSGQAAAQESKAAVDYFSQLITAGFEAADAIKMINNMQIITKNDESFATLDAALIDRIIGEIKFYKIGAAASFIKRVGEVTAIKAVNPPLGVSEKIDAEPVNWRVAAGDVLIMASDGVIEARLQGIDKEPWLVNALRRRPAESAQDTADAILKEALKAAGNKIKDDFTIMVVRFKSDQRRNERAW